MRKKKGHTRYRDGMGAVPRHLDSVGVAQVRQNFFTCERGRGSA